MAFYITVALIFIETKRGKEGTKKSKYHMDLGETEACRKRVTEATKGVKSQGIRRGYQGLFSF